MERRGSSRPAISLPKNEIPLSVQSSAPGVHFDETAKLPNGIATYDNLPRRRNEKVFGRDAELQKIMNSLDATNNSSTGFPSVVLYGSKGTAKSDIALEFAYRNMHRFPVILWVNSETEDSIQQSFQKIAIELLKSPNASHNHIADHCGALLTWLQETDFKWLLIYDKLEDNTTFEKYRPVSSKTGAAIITSRNPALSSPAIEINELPGDIENRM